MTGWYGAGVPVLALSARFRACPCRRSKARTEHPSDGGLQSALRPCGKRSDGQPGARSIVSWRFLSPHRPEKPQKYWVNCENK